MSQSFPCLDSPRAQILGKKAKLPESNAPAYLHYESQQQVEVGHSFLKKRTSPRGNFSLLLAGRLRPSSRQQTEYFSNPLGLKRFFKKRHFREAEILNCDPKGRRARRKNDPPKTEKFKIWQPIKAWKLEKDDILKHLNSIKVSKVCFVFFFPSFSYEKWFSLFPPVKIQKKGVQCFFDFQWAKRLCYAISWAFYFF